jgi:hypothetical protein
VYFSGLAPDPRGCGSDHDDDYEKDVLGFGREQRKTKRLCNLFET